VTLGAFKLHINQELKMHELLQ